jgi:hypothetical protein
LAIGNSIYWPLAVVSSLALGSTAATACTKAAVFIRKFSVVGLLFRRESAMIASLLLVWRGRFLLPADNVMRDAHVSPGLDVVESIGL